MVTVGSVITEFKLPLNFSKKELVYDIKNPTFNIFLDVIRSPPTTQKQAYAAAKKLRNSLDLNKLKQVKIGRTNIYDLFASVNPAWRGDFNYDIQDVFTKRFVKRNCSALRRALKLLPKDIRSKFKNIINAQEDFSLDFLSGNALTFSEGLFNFAASMRKESSTLFINRFPLFKNSYTRKMFLINWFSFFSFTIVLTIFGATILRWDIPTLPNLVKLLFFSLVLTFSLESLGYSMDQIRKHLHDLDKILEGDSNKSQEWGYGFSDFAKFWLALPRALGFKIDPISKRKKPTPKKLVEFYFRLNMLLKEKSDLERDLEPDRTFPDFSRNDIPTAPFYTEGITKMSEIFNMVKMLYEDSDWFNKFKEIIENSPKVSKCKREIIKIFEEIIS